MFKGVAFSVSLILAIICGNAIGDAIDSGLVGFVGGFIVSASSYESVSLSGYSLMRDR